MRSSCKAIQIATLLLFTQAAISGVMGDEALSDYPYNGLYGGINIGVSDLIDKETTSGPSASHQLSATGIIGGGLVGYDYTLYDRLKLGVEGFVNATALNLAARDFSPPASYLVNSHVNAGVRLLPGWEITTNAIAHLILGYTNASITIQDNGNYGYIDQSFNKSGFQAGLGFKTALTEHIWLRADALYATYGTINAIGGNSNPSYAYQNYSNNLSTLEGDLTLVYKF